VSGSRWVSACRGSIEPHGTATEDPDSVGAFNLGQLRAEISAAYRAGGMPDDGVGRFFDLMSKPGG